MIMTTSKVDSKRQRLSSFHHNNTTVPAPPPPPPPPLPPPPPPHVLHSVPPAPVAAPPQPHRRPSSSAEPRYRPYSGQSNLLEPMHSYQNHESSDPVQHHHGHPYHSRQYSNEPITNRTPTTPSQPGSAVDTKPMLTGGYSEPYRPAPDIPTHTPVYHPHDQHVPHTVGMAHEMPRGSAQYPSLVQQAPDPSYDMHYQYQNSMLSLQGDGQPRRKAVRASQACESCRAKKCKCDEEKPECGNCRQNGTQCQYRDVPPPKQERTMMQVMEQISALGNQIAELGQRLDHFSQVANPSASHSDMKHIHRILDEIRRAQTPPKRLSETSLSPAQRAQQHSPRVQPKYEHPASRHVELSTHRDSFHAPSPASSQLSESDTNAMKKMAPPPLSSRLSTVQKGSEKEVLDERIRNFDPLNGQLSIPQNHTTAAHKLLTHWSAIKPFYETLFDETYAKNYVMLEEKNRGVMRIFGQGEGHDDNTGKPRLYACSPSVQSEFGSTTSSSARTDGFWGVGFDSPVNNSPGGGSENLIGGLNIDGSLCLDAHVVRRLRDSFLDNIWILHPFMNKDDIYHNTERFIRQYSPKSRSDSQSLVTSPDSVDVKPEFTSTNKGFKRKRSNGETEDYQTPQLRPHSSLPRIPVERSVTNALVLFILALGRLCEHKSPDIPLPAPVSEHHTYLDQSPYSPMNHAPSPSYHSAKSPASSTPISVGTPGMHHERLVARGISRTSSQDSQGAFVRQGRGLIRNVDRIPGLAYYAYACNIWGENYGSPDLVKAHACIVAGLYQGQMTRVMDSWKWIHEASVQVRCLFTDLEELNGMPHDKADAIRIAFWTCLQLESDILAELDLLPSGISALEDRMLPPQGRTLNSNDQESKSIMYYYWAQIHLRKILNRAHSALYNITDRSITNPGWTISNADELARQLHDWRTTLPADINWDSDQDLARHINDARLRAKYYGALYIVHRPFLHHILQDEFGPSHGGDQYKHIIGFKPKQEIVDLSTKCVEAAVNSTRAFDGLDTRPIITNPFGTAHAQFGNILVLCALRRSTRHGWMIKDDALEQLLQRTYKFLGNLAPVSPTMQTNLKILQCAQNKLCDEGKLCYDAAASMERALSKTHHEQRVATADIPSHADSIPISGFSAANATDAVNAANTSFSSAYSQ